MQLKRGSPEISFKNKVVFVLILIFLFLFIFYPKLIQDSAKDGLFLWLLIVLPAIFPFLVLLDIILATDFFHRIGKLIKPLSKPIFFLSGMGVIPVVIGFIGGFPLGAKLTSSLYQKNQLTKNEAQRILGLSSGASPAFLFGAVSTGLLQVPSIGVYFYLGQVVTIFFMAFFSGLFYRFCFQFNKSKSSTLYDDYTEINSIPSQSFEETICDAVSNSMFAIIKIGGFIIVFSVISTLVNSVLLQDKAPELLSSFIFGFFEMTRGVEKVSQLTVPLFEKVVYIGIITGFSGLCVYLQTAMFARKVGLSMGLFIRYKLLQGLLTPIFTILLLFFSPKRDIISIKPVFSEMGQNPEYLGKIARTTPYLGIAQYNMIFIVLLLFLFVIPMKMKKGVSRRC